MPASKTAALSATPLRQAVTATSDLLVTTVVADIGLPTALANAAGRVTNAAVGSLLGDPAVRVFASRLAVTVLGGGDVPFRPQVFQLAGNFVEPVRQ